MSRQARNGPGLDTEPIALTGVYKNMTRAIIALVFRCKITGALAGKTKPPTSAGPPKLRCPA